MDGVNFLKEWKRMCEANTIGKPFGTCCQSNCKLLKVRKNQTDSCRNTVLNNIDKSIKIVEQWSKEHPKKTRLDDFKEKYPNAKIDEYFYGNVCCEYIGYVDNCPHEYDECACKDCWNEPVD